MRKLLPLLLLFSLCSLSYEIGHSQTPQEKHEQFLAEAKASGAYYDSNADTLLLETFKMNNWDYKIYVYNANPIDSLPKIAKHTTKHTLVGKDSIGRDIYKEELVFPVEIIPFTPGYEKTYPEPFVEYWNKYFSIFPKRKETVYTLYNQLHDVKASSNSTPTTATEKQEALLTPKYYTNWIGASFFTISTIEHECDVKPVRILGLTFFYDFGKCFVGFEANTKGVIIQMTLRLFGEEAERFIKDAVDYGYELCGKGSNLNVRSNSGKFLPDLYGTKVLRYSKATDNGKVIMEVSTSENYANEYEIAIFRTK